MKLIGGFFVQHRHDLPWDIADTKLLETLGYEGFIPVMYAGVIYEDSAGKSEGNMIDVIGESELSEIVITQSQITFTKRYNRYKILGSQANIFYSLDRREENTWVGTWRHSGGSGLSLCIIADINGSLFRNDAERFAHHLFGTI